MRKYVEWMLIAVIIGSLVLLGQNQLHQKSIKLFLAGSYLIILLVMMAFYWIRHKIERFKEEKTKEQ